MPTASPRRIAPFALPTEDLPCKTYVLPLSLLDTEWGWEYPQVINEYIRNTMEDNFRLFEKYPHYIFNFAVQTAIAL